jgi:malate dehydrogenase (oxaloacetate-decarboxylating)(NADP+)
VARLRGPAYDELLEEFVQAVQEVFPRACLQFEDFGNANAFALLHRYQNRICTFNDDIQGTAAVTLAGLYSAARLSGRPLRDQRILFYGAGEAGIGIGDLIVDALVAEGVPVDVARRQCWFVDSKGLIVRERTDLVSHKQRYAHEHPPVRDLKTAIESLRPHALIGVSGQGASFDDSIVRAMGAHNDRPIVFALSNPTSKSECSAEQAYTWTEGRAIFASGSPFPPCTLGGRVHVSGQGNNAYIFPGVGLGVVVTQSTRVTNEMFLAAARALADLATPADLAVGRVYPALTRIREVSAAIALGVAEVAYAQGHARRPRPADLAAAIRAEMYEPDYPDYS